MSDDRISNEARVLAIMAMQSERYASEDMDFRDQVDKVYALVEAEPPSPPTGEPTKSVLQGIEEATQNLGREVMPNGLGATNSEHSTHMNGAPGEPPTGEPKNTGKGYTPK